MERSGVRVLVDLRNDDEVLLDTVRPPQVVVERRPVEDQSDVTFMGEWSERLGSPGYYTEVLRRWPSLVTAVFTAVADVCGDAVLIHCGAGRDRTGMITAMILELVGVDREAIVDDYERGVRDTNEWLRLNDRREKPQSDEALEQHILRARAELVQFLDETPVERYLRGAGVSSEAVERIRSRLLDE
jgi:protein-tyrosine phosphatase